MNPTGCVDRLNSNELFYSLTSMNNQEICHLMTISLAEISSKSFCRPWAETSWNKRKRSELLSQYSSTPFLMLGISIFWTQLRTHITQNWRYDMADKAAVRRTLSCGLKAELLVSSISHLRTSLRCYFPSSTGKMCYWWVFHRLPCCWNWNVQSVTGRSTSVMYCTIPAPLITPAWTCRC